MIIRRHRSLTSTPKMLDSFLGLSFGTTGPSPHFADSHRSGLSASASPSSHSPGIVRSVLKRFVVQFFSADRQKILAHPNSFPSHLATQPERSDGPESLLQAEQERTKQLTQELLTVRSALKQMNDLQADLAVERETGKQLVKFLEEAEQEARKVPFLEQLLRQRIDASNRSNGTHVLGPVAMSGRQDLLPAVKSHLAND